MMRTEWDGTPKTHPTGPVTDADVDGFCGLGLPTSYTNCNSDRECLLPLTFCISNRCQKSYITNPDYSNDDSGADELYDNAKDLQGDGMHGIF